MDFSPAGTGRMLVALGVLGLLALSVWLTMEPGKYRTLTWVLLAFFAFPGRAWHGLRSRRLGRIESCACKGFRLA